MTVIRLQLAAALSAGVMVSVQLASGQTLSPYSDFQAMTPAEMGSLQVKFTHVAHRRSEVASFLFRATGHAPDVSVFAPYYRAQFLPGLYNGDFQTFNSFSASPIELRAVIDSIATLSQITVGTVDSAGYLSFAMAGVHNDTVRVFERVVRSTNGKLIFGRLLAALAANDSAKAALLSYACAVGMLPQGPPSDVTNRIAIRVRGFRKDRGNGNFVGTARLTNTSGQSITGPMIFVFQPPGDVDAVSPSGRTCAIYPYGAPFYTLPIGSSLAPNQSVTLTLRLNNPDEARIELSYQRVYAGAGYP
jgi:hypothetical protein